MNDIVAVSAEGQRRIRKFVDQVTGGAPRECTGWKAKIYNAAWQAVALAVADCESRHPDLEPAVPAEGDLAIARKAAERVVMARLTRAPIDKRPAIQQRVAQIRAGLGDEFLEVQSVIEALAIVRGAA